MKNKYTLIAYDKNVHRIHSEEKEKEKDVGVMF